MITLTRKQIIIIVVVIMLVFIGVVVASFIVNKIEKDRLNPGGTGGGYTPQGFVILEGIDSDFRLSDSQFITIRTGLEDFLKNKQPNKSDYIVTANKDKLATDIQPNLYQYTTFTVLVNKKDIYSVYFLADYITDWKDVYISDNNSTTINNITIFNINTFAENGIPGYVLDNLSLRLKDKFKDIKSISPSNLKVTINDDSSRTVNFSADSNIGKLTIDLVFNYNLDNVGTLDVTDIKSGEKYSTSLEHTIHE